MALPAILGGVAMGGSLLGAISAASHTPSYDMSAMDRAYNLILQQQENLNKYFKQAGESLESQYKTYYGTSMQDAINKLASEGTYSSPVGQLQLNRKQQALADVYAKAKADLAGQRVAAEGNISQQQVNYYQNLAQLNYQKALAQSQSESGLFSAIGGLGGALLSL